MSENICQATPVNTVAAAAQCKYSSSLMSESSASTSPSITDFFPLQQETARPMRKAYKQKHSLETRRLPGSGCNLYVCSNSLGSDSELN